MRSTTGSVRSGAGWRRAAALSLSTAVFIPFAAPSAAQAADLQFEGETMTAMTLDPTDKQMWPQAFSDSSASGAKAFKFGPNSSASKRVTTDATVGLALRARGDQCSGAPSAKVKVDGVEVAAFAVSATAWTTYAQAIDLPAGAHTVDVSFDNNYYESGRCNRNLLVDSLTLSSGTGTTPGNDTVAPGQPTGLTALAGDGRVTLDWSDNTDSDLAGYDVYRSTTAGTAYAKVTTAPLTSSSYVDLGRTNGTRYYYVVKAVDASGNASAGSSEATAVPASAMVPAPSASVLWTADAERPTNDEWSSESSADKSYSYTQVADAAQGSRAYRHEIRDGDVSDDGLPRVEVGQCNGNAISGGLAECPANRRFNAGDERWIAFQVRFDQWNATTTATNNFMQMKNNGNGAPPILMKLRSGKLSLSGVSSPSSGSTQETLWSAPWSSDLKGKWLQVMLHIKFGRTSTTGYVELYGDIDGNGTTAMKPLMARKNRHTMRSTGDMWARIGVYRKEVSGTAVMLHDGYTVATTREAAEASAYGR
jgi:Polysaccharide lyase/Ca-dependent carbohydrate-binding module xylan-binding